MGQPQTGGNVPPMQQEPSMSSVFAEHKLPQEPSLTAESSTDMSAELEELRTELDAARNKAAEAWDQVLRAKAEAENTRRRAQEEVSKAHKFGIERFAESLVPVRDSLEAALATQNASVESMREGIHITLRQLGTAFEKNGLIELDPVGERFDPHRHQAIAMVPSDAEPNTVVTVMQKGYMIADRVLRPALVSVAAPRS